jgi:hypothetical protein
MPTKAAVLLEQLDIVFTVIFTAELAVNMISNLWDRFVNDSWCVLHLLTAYLTALYCSSITTKILSQLISFSY